MKIIKFAKEVYEPILHIVYSAMWFFSLLGTLILVEGSNRVWHFDWQSIAAILTLFLVLFFLRIADELKDLDYDMVHNPDRPLVVGTVTEKDLHRYLVIVAILTSLLNIWMSQLLTLIVVLDMFWGILLIRIEKASKIVKDNMLVNLLFTYPVNIALGVYIYTFFLQNYGTSLGPKGVGVVVAFAFAFLNYEFSRKISWIHPAETDERLYSSALGSPASAILTFMFSLISTCILLFLVKPWGAEGILSYVGWLVLTPCIASCLGLYRFFLKRKSQKKYTAYGMAFVSLFYLALVVIALSTNDIVVG